MRCEFTKHDEYEKGIDMLPLAETWECSTQPDGPSYVVGGEYDGKELAEVLKKHPEFLESRHQGLDELPILIKFIDAKTISPCRYIQRMIMQKSMRMDSLVRQRCGIY